MSYPTPFLPSEVASYEPASANTPTTVDLTSLRYHAPKPDVIPFLFATAERRHRRAHLRESQPLPTTDNNQEKGAWVESIFQACAIARGFTVYRPWGSYSGIDFILERDGRLLRIQVKSAWERAGYHYFFITRRSAVGGKVRTYGSTVDFFVGYVPPLNAWYIIPASEVRRPNSGICVFPPDGMPKRDKAGRRHKRRTTFDYEVFRERWDLLEE